jgi:hypothetical protein
MVFGYEPNKPLVNKPGSLLVSFNQRSVPDSQILRLDRFISFLFSRAIGKKSKYASIKEITGEIIRKYDILYSQNYFHRQLHKNQLGISTSKLETKQTREAQRIETSLVQNHQSKA